MDIVGRDVFGLVSGTIEGGGKLAQSRPLVEQDGTKLINEFDEEMR
jgi:hypothetical protein